MSIDRKIVENVILVAGGVLIGGSTTYILTNKIIKRKYRDIAEAEIESVKETYKLLRKEGEYSDPRTALKAHLERLDELDSYKDQLDEQGYFITEDEKPAEEAPDGVDETAKTPQQLLDETAPHRPEDGRPFVISVDEFMEDMPEYEKLTITYYEEDHTLVDEREATIDDVIKTIGEDTLKFMGWRSSSPDCLYVRNPRLSVDFEILRDPQSYSEVVLGIKPSPPGESTMSKMRNDE